MVRSTWGDKTLLLGGKWLSEEKQNDYWDLKWGATPLQSINLADGSTVSAMPFTITARPDGATPKILAKIHDTSPLTLRIYRRQANGQYTVYSHGVGVSLVEGEYAILANTPPANSPENYTLLFMGSWILP